MVEGDAENILLPAIANVIGRPLVEHGVSIVNVGSTAYKRYANIFLRRDGQRMDIPVSIITDLDVRSIEYYNDPEETKEKKVLHCTSDIKAELSKLCSDVDYSELPEYVKTRSELQDYLSAHKPEKQRVKKTLRESLDAFFQANISSVTPEYVKWEREEKHKIFDSMYPDGDVKLYAAKSWTLEYEIASSSLYQELNMAVLMAKAEQANKGLAFEDAKKKTEADFPDGTNDDVAYKIFKPINDGSVSKAIVAQYLSEILLSNEGNYRSIIETDKYLAYIVDAIKHVTTIKQ